ncbi:MAG: peptidylprolyl isomerase [Prevotella sp.]|jgi:FKBP-type peptidyl-prolyl cis-trans isomerase SlyD|nr:peptidylprolyl isomerase [Prevotella sp.]MBR1620662.1 peptidylprolyl isomerase [Prevotella sp.]
MEEKKNLFIATTYKLETIENGEKKLIEEATEERPFVFISGFGIALEAFEKNLVELKKDDAFDFTLMQEEAYGAYIEDRVLDLDREMFCINGHFDHDNIYVDAVVPLQNEDGNRFMGRVLAISDDKVKMDLNHPLAGKDLNFSGKIIESREATNEEIQQIINHMSGEGCGCGCGECGDDCNHDHSEEGCGCGCGHCH